MANSFNSMNEPVLEIVMNELRKLRMSAGFFQKSYVIFGGGMYKYLLFFTGVGGWSGKGQKQPYVI